MKPAKSDPTSQKISQRRRPLLRRRRLLVAERLEDRRLLAVTAQLLGPENHVVFQGDGNADTVQFSVVDGYLQHNLGNLAAFASNRDLDSSTPGEQALLLSEIGSLTFNDSGENDRVLFGGSEAFDFADAALNFSVGRITVSPGVNISTTGGAIDLLAAETILVSSGSVLSTVDGGIVLTANRDASTSASSDFFSIYLDGATLSTSGAGSILLEGTGLHSGSNFSAGVGIEGGTTIVSTSEAADAGTIQISGFGADGLQLKHGVIAREAGNSIQSAYGNIRIEGVGGFRSDGGAANFWGVYLAGLDISSTGTGPDAAEISIYGVGGAEVSGNHGVRMISSNVSLSSIDGDITITGRGGDAPTTSAQSGVVIQDVSQIRSTGTGPNAANIRIMGTVGTATAPQTSALVAYGVELTGASTEVSTVDGDIIISGSGGEGGISRNGVTLAANIASTGIGDEAGNITIAGQAGTTGNGLGALIAGTWSTVDGDISITGQGTSTSLVAGTGLQISGLGSLMSSGAGTDAGRITLSGVGGSIASRGGTGVTFSGTNGMIGSVDGDIQIVGTAGAGNSSSNVGIFVTGSTAGIASTGTANITLEGHGAAGISGNVGILVESLTSGISSTDGDIAIVGRAGAGSSCCNTGLSLASFGIIESKGTGANAGKILLSGTGATGSSGNVGVVMSGLSASTIRSQDGDIHIVGTGGDWNEVGSSSINKGIVMTGVSVESTGTTGDAATVTFEGHAGVSTTSVQAVELVDSTVSSVVGDIQLLGSPAFGNAGSVSLLRTDIQSSGTAPLAADILVSGSGVSVSGNINTVNGDVSLVGLDGSSASGSGTITSTGTGRIRFDGGTVNYSGTVRSESGDMTFHGPSISVGNIESTGTDENAARILIGDDSTHSIIIGGLVSSVSGDIDIKNNITDAATGVGYVWIYGNITSTGTDPANAAKITIDGTGANNQTGVYFIGNNQVISSVMGDITITGRGGDASSTSSSITPRGVWLRSITKILSTGTVADAARITIHGTGGAGGINSTGTGVYFDGNNAGEISSVIGPISITGVGGAGTGRRNAGVHISNALIASTGTTIANPGLNAATITIDGTGGTGTSDNEGVRIDLDAAISSIEGAISITGVGGNGNDRRNAGVYVRDAVIASTGTTIADPTVSAATITINGVGGTGTSDNEGVRIDRDAAINSIDGAVSIHGAGGSNSHGALLNSLSSIVSTGNGNAAATITVDGTAGLGTTGSGVLLRSTTISSDEGAIAVTGRGNTGRTYGINIEGATNITSTGVGANAATIDLIGIGGNGSSLNDGVYFRPTGSITSIDGDIMIHGTAGNNSMGTHIGGGTIASLGTTPEAAKISIFGSSGEVGLHGIFLLASGLITSEFGDIFLRGEANSIGIWNGSGTTGALKIQSTGLGADAANIRIEGTGSSGVALGAGNGNEITTIDGDISITGSGRGSGSQAGLPITSTGTGPTAGNITIIGTGDLSSGVNIGAAVTTTDGDITITGTAGDGSSSSRGVTISDTVSSIGTGGDAGRITISGTTATVGANGVHLDDGSGAITGSFVTAVDGDITITGSTAGGAGSGVLLRQGVTSTGADKEHAAQIQIDGAGGPNGGLGVFIFGGNETNPIISTVAGDVLLTGTGGSGGGSGNRGIWLRSAYVISTGATTANAGKITLEGTGGSGGTTDLFGVDLDTSMSNLVSVAGDIEIIATAGVGSGTNNSGLRLTGSSLIGNVNTTGDITIRTDSINLMSGAIQSTGNLTIEPKTSGMTVGLGGGVGDLNLDDAELALLADGFSLITIGSSNAGAIDINTATFTDDVIISGATISDHGGTDIDVGEGTVTLLGRIEPGGALPGVLSVIGNLALGAQVLGIQIAGTTPGETSGDHDQLQVAGAVTIDPQAQLELTSSNGFSPAVGQQFVVIDNVGTDPISGAFAGLPEGSIINNFLGSTFSARVSYLGIDAATGNDLVLTITEPNSPPVAVVGGPYIITVGASLTLDASDSSDPDDDPLTFAWDLTGNTEFADAAGASPTLSWESLVALGIVSPGDYQVTVKVDDGVDSDIAATTLTVLRATPSITIDWTGGTYNGNEFSATGSVLGFDNSEIGSPTFTYFFGVDTTGTPLAAAPIDAGVYTVQATFAGDSLHTEISLEKSITIDRAAADILVSGTTATYDGTAYGATGSATGVNNEPLAGLELGNTFIDAPGGIAAWTFTDVTGNYNVASGSVEINILKAPQTIDWNTPEPVLLGTALSATQLNATVSVGGPALAGELMYAPDFGVVLDAGVHELTVTAAETENYLEATASVFLTVNYVPWVTLISGHKAVDEDSGLVTITAQLDQAVGFVVTVPMLVEGITATLGEDFQPLGNAFTFLPGETTASLTVLIIDDASFEESETFSVGLVETAEARLGIINQNTITILDNDLVPQISFATPTGTTTETSATIALEVRLSAPTFQDVTIPLTFAGSAELSVDYLTPQGSVVVIPAGQTSGMATIEIIDDTIPEPNELIIVGFGTPINGTISNAPGASLQHVLTILQNDSPSVAFTSSQRRVSENIGTVLVEAKLSERSPLEVRVPFSVHGTAFDEDRIINHEPAPYEIVIPPNHLSGNISVTIVDDDLKEPGRDETVELRLGNPTNALLGSTRRHVLSIQDNDVAEIQFTQTRQEVWENGRTATFTVETTNPSDEPIVIPIIVSGRSGVRSGQASYGSDFTVSTSTLVIPAGKTSVSRTVTIVNDTINEPGPPERIVIGLGTPSGGAQLARQNTQHTILIKDDDPLVTISRSTSSIVETTTNASNHPTFTISLSAPTNRSVNVPFTISGTAARGLDYTLFPTSSVSIPAGQTSQKVTVNIKNDSIDEPNETITLTLGRPTGGARLGSTKAATITIVDNDGAPSVSWGTPSRTITEANRSSPYTIQLNRVSGKDVYVKVDFSGTAKRNSDYTISGLDSRNRLLIKAGQLSATFRVRVIDDKLAEPSESIVMRINSATNATLPKSRTRTFTIADNDQPPKPPAPKPNSTTAAAGTLVLSTDFSMGSYDNSSTSSDLLSGLAVPIDQPSTGSLAIFTGTTGLLDAATAYFDANFNGVRDYLDLNNNGIQDEDEPSEPLALTQLDGSFAIEIPAEFDRDGDGIFSTSEGRWILTGGVDSAIGLPLRLQLTAAVGHYVVTPLSTVVERLVTAHEFELADAEARMLQAFAIEGVSLATNNPVRATVSGDQNAAITEAASIRVSSTVQQIADLFAGTPGAPSFDFLGDLVFTTLAEKITPSGSLLDLGVDAVVAGVIESVSNSSGILLDPNPTTHAEIISGASQVIAAGNQAIDAIENTVNLAYLNHLFQVKKVMLGEASPALREVTAGTRTIASVVTEFTGANLQAKIGQASIGMIVPPTLLVQNSAIIEGDSGQRMLEMVVRLVGEHIQQVSVDYATHDDTASSDAGDYVPVQGTLNWGPGDNSDRIIQIPINGNTTFAPDKNLTVMLSNPTAAVIGNAVGYGFILNDDELQHTASATPSAGTNTLLLGLGNNEFSLLGNDEVVSEGEIALQTSMTIVGQNDLDDTLLLDFAPEVNTQAISFHGGTGGLDRIEIIDGTFQRITHAWTGPKDGVTAFLPAESEQPLMLNWTDVESFFTRVGNVSELIFELPAGTTDAILEDVDPTDETQPGMMRLHSASGAFEPIVFANPEVSITVRGTGVGFLTIASLDAAFLGEVNVIEDYAPDPPGEVAIVDGDLLLNMPRQATARMTIALDPLSEEFIFSSPTSSVISGNGSTQSGDNAVRVPVASVTGALIVNGGEGNDILTLDFASGNPVPIGGLAFSGGQGNDVLRLIGTGVENPVYSPDPLVFGNGQIVVGGKTVTFSGLEPVDLDNVGIFTLALPGADDAIAVTGGLLTDNLSEALVISGTSGGFAFVSTRVRSSEIVIDTTFDDGDDSVTIANADNAHSNTGLTILTGGGSDAVWVDSAANFAGPVSIMSPRINLAANLSTIAGSSAGDLSLTGNVSVNGPVTLNTNHLTGAGDVLIDGALLLNEPLLVTSGTGNVSFSGTVDGHHALNIESQGATLFGAAVGKATPLASLGVDMGGTTSVLDVTTIGIQNYGNDLLVNGALTTTNDTVSVAGGTTVTGPTTIEVGSGLVALAAGLMLEASTNITANELVLVGDLGFVINGPEVDTDYAQLRLSGMLNLNGVNLLIDGSYAPTTDDSFVLINKVGLDPFIGTLKSLPEGTLVTINSGIIEKKISYIGGDGNELVLKTAANNPVPVVDETNPASSVVGSTFDPISGQFDIQVSFADAIGVNGAAAAGVKEIDIYYRVNPQNANSSTQWFASALLTPTTLSGTTTLSGLLNALPGDVVQLWSVATDAAGNVENEVVPRTDYSFVIADTVGPQTQVDSASFDGVAFIDLVISGTDVGGGNIASIEVYMEINPGTIASTILLVGTIGGGANAVNGSLQFAVPQDGVMRDYRFFSIGTDHLGNREGGSGTFDGDPGAGGDALVTGVLLAEPAAAEIISFDANAGLENRSSVHSADLLFNDANFVDELMASLHDNDSANDRIRLERRDLAGNRIGDGEFLAIAVIRDGLKLRLDFGAAGLLQNGVYAIHVDMDGDTTNGYEQFRRFHRLLGDINGDGVVNTADLLKARQAHRNPTLHADADVNGDGRVDTADLRFFSTFLRLTDVEKELRMSRGDLDD